MKMVPVTILVLLCTVLAHSATAFPCASSSFVDSYANLPAVPAFATTPYSGPALSSDQLVTNHYSEVAVMARPDTLTSIDGTQTNCPHMQAGLKLWHDSLIWTAVPAANANVTLPTNSKVLVSSCSVDPNAVFGIITIPSTSELIFADADISFQARGFNVQGALRIGSPTCRLRSKITITLVGTRNAQSLPTAEFVKGILVTGEVDIHGVQYFPTWTRLAKTLSPGENMLYVQDLVNWQAGQQIVVTTTELKDARDFNRNEQFTITAVQRFSDSVSAVSFSPASQYKHYAGREYQAEVALLSRNILVQGDATGSPPADTGPVTCRDPTDNSTFPCNDVYLTGFGAHIIAKGTKARFSGLEVFRGGQTNVLARYPIHFHMMGHVTQDTAFARDCAVHESYFRCYAIHGTHGVLLRENVAYDAIGSCYFIEDGVEENNTLAYNLGALVHTIGPVQNPSLGINANGGGQFWSQTLSYIDESPSQVLPSDLGASVFYFTNPAQYVLGNAASGGWAGFGFPALRNAVKLHEFLANGTTPKDRPLWLFKGNTAHSSGFFWGSAAGVYVGGELFHKTPGGPLTYTPGRVVSATRDTCAEDPKAHYGYCPEELQLWQRFEDLKVFLINGRGIQHWGDRAEFIRVETWDCSLSMNVFGKVFIDNGLNVCRNANHAPTFLSGCPTAPKTNIPANVQNTYKCNTRDRFFFEAGTSFQFYDVGQRHILRNVEFRNCDWTQIRPCYWNCTGGSVWTLLSHSSQFVPEFMQATMQIKYTNCSSSNVWQFSTELVDADGPTISGRIQGWYDVDGSVGLLGRRSMLGSTRAGRWWRYNDQCLAKDEMWVCPLLSSQDSAASVVITGTHWNESHIGVDQCMNGLELIPRNCPVVGKVTSFGMNEQTNALDLGMNAKITGPIIGSSGGWFIRLSPAQGMGAPGRITISQPEVDPKDRLILAFPYPSGTSFRIAALAASWCDPRWSECVKNFTQVETMDEVRYGDGSKFMFRDQILYIRIATQAWDNFGKRNTNWTLPAQPSQFARAGVALMSTSDQYRIVIQATGCGGGATSNGFQFCDALPSVQVPAALGEVPLCTFPKPDFAMNCVFVQPQIELIVEFFVWSTVALILWGRTVILTPFRLICEHVVMSPVKTALQHRKRWVDVGAFSSVSLLGFAMIICAADYIAVQISVAILILMLFAAMWKFSRQMESPMTKQSKLILCSFAMQFVAVSLAFVVSYFSSFSGLRLYTMLPAVVFVMHPVWDLVPPSKSAYHVSSSSPLASTLALSASSKEQVGDAKPVDTATPTRIYASMSKRVLFASVSMGIAAAAIYFAFVVATLY